ncbi:thioredoxin-related protein [Mangrovibacterium marinum]|uniref:Thioredoxin-related protein n=2 Tax=Mangrovibacterium marinum TaxID=1639118 RepID=A0A2T5C4J1_9BACT|nr:thioredoxin-related protein [Mangrovibacterium marinum]
MLLLLAVASSLSAQNWLTSFDEAKATARQENKKLIMVFQGSDWCAPCMKLERKIWNSDRFKAYAKQHFVMLKLDFPRKKANALPEAQQQQNEQLAEEYNKHGFFPLVVVLDSEGQLLGETGYKQVSPDEYIEIINSL